MHKAALLYNVGKPITAYIVDVRKERTPLGSGYNVTIHYVFQVQGEWYERVSVNPNLPNIFKIKRDDSFPGAYIPGNLNFIEIGDPKANYKEKKYEYIWMFVFLIAWYILNYS